MKGLSCCSGKSADRKFKRKSKRYLKKGDKYIQKNTQKNTKKKKNSVHPSVHLDEKPQILNEKRNFKVSKEYVDSLMCELIVCGTCNQLFSLGSDKIVGNCGGCNKFLHCGIAGKCIGPDCSVKRGNKEHRLTWCIDCVPKQFTINQSNNDINGDCLCLECSNDDTIPKMYKRKI